MDNAYTDAWRWTIPDVVFWVCNSLPHFASAIPNALLPDIDGLAASFQDHEVSGHVLLTDVTTEFLKTECNIKVHGRRSTVLAAIRDLQRSSASWISQSSPIQDQTLVLRSGNSQASRIISTPHSPFHDALKLPLSSLAPSLTPPRDKADAQSSIPAVQSAPFALARKREILIDDGTGRKRRKLDLTGQVSNRKSLVVSHNDSSASQLMLSFLPDTKLSLDDLMFGDIGLGSPIPDPANDEFMVAHTPLAAGTRHFAYRQMLHLFRSTYPRTVPYKGKDTTALFPYRKELLQHGFDQSLIVLPNSDSELSIRVNEAMLRGNEQALPTLQEGNEWNFLIEKYHAQPDDYLLPLYEESDDYSVSSSFFAEFEEDELERQKASADKFSRNDADKIVESAIMGLAETWSQTKLPRLEERSAYAIWRSGRASTSKAAVVRSQNKHLIERLTTRLERMRADLVDQAWNNKTELKRQCAILQPSVEDLEVERWKQALWKRSVAPCQAQRHSKKPLSSTNAVEEKPAAADEDAVMNDFIVHDGDDHILQMETSGHESSSSEWSSPLWPSQRRGKRPSHAGVSLREDAGTEGTPARSDEDDDDDSSVVGSPSGEIRSSPPMVGTRIKHPDVEDSMSSSDEASVGETAYGFVTPQSESKTGPTATSNSPDVIVLSSSDFSSPAQLSTKKTQPFKGRPYTASKKQISNWDERVIMGMQDRQRLLCKIFLSLEPSIINQMHGQLLNNEPSELWLERMVQKILDQKSKEQGPINSSSIHAIMQQFARLYSCWYHCDRSYWDRELPEVLWKPAVDTNDLARWARHVAKELPRIAQFPDKPLSTVAPSKPKQSTIIIDSSEEVKASNTPKKKKKSTKRDASAKKTRENAKHRMEKFNESQKNNSNDAEVLAVFLSGSDTDHDKVLVNIARDDEEAPVFFNPEIVRRLKNHQIEGVRFLWREATVSKEEGGQGCVLAHTMGLGKTCQTVTFLVVLQEAIDNPETCTLIPQDLQPLRALILCPPSIVQNWVREIELWSPSPRRGFFKVFKIESGMNEQNQRLATLRDWSKTNGILVMGYTMFSNYIKAGDKSRDDPESTTTDQSCKPQKVLTNDEAQEAANILLNSATLVIADEAHELKNEATVISKAAARINVHRRIALTGTPMSNNTQEIYSLINWAAPNYLGSSAEFRQRFGIPIEDGNYANSSRETRRRSMKKLVVLNSEIAPKINRANIEVLKGALPSKTEYNLTIPLTELQKQIYSKFVDIITGAFGDRDKVETVRLFGWVAILNLLCNHPKAFRNKLLEPKKAPRNSKAALLVTDTDDQPLDGDTVEQAAIRGDEHVTRLGMTPEMVQDLVAEIPEQISIEGSYRMVMIEKILRLSLDCGDKVLIFSHSIPTLNCTGELLDDLNIRWGRIDGSLHMLKRERTLNEFRSGRLDVLLISTRAGGQGLNMQDANRVIIIDFGFNPSWEEQAVGRAYRLGQRKSVFVYRFVAGGTFEERLYRMGLFKKGLSSRVVDKKNPERQMDRDVKLWIFHPKDVAQGDVDSECGKDPEVLDKIISQQQSGLLEPIVRSIKTTDTLQREADDEPLNAEEQLEVQNEALQLTMHRGKPAGVALFTPPMAAIVSSAPVGRIAPAELVAPVAQMHRPYPLPAMIPPQDAAILTMPGNRPWQSQGFGVSDSTRASSTPTSAVQGGAPLTFGLTQQRSTSRNSLGPQPGPGGGIAPYGNRPVRFVRPPGADASFFRQSYPAYQHVPVPTVPWIQNGSERGSSPRSTAAMSHSGSRMTLSPPNGLNPSTAAALPSAAMPPYQHVRPPTHSPSTLGPHSRTPSRGSATPGPFSASFGVPPGGAPK